MSNSRIKQKMTDSGQNFIDSSEDSAPDSPAIKVKLRDSQIARDSLYYHPAKHPDPKIAALFRQKSNEVERDLKNAADASKEPQTTNKPT